MILKKQDHHFETQLPKLISNHDFSQIWLDCWLNLVNQVLHTAENMAVLHNVLRCGKSIGMGALKCYQIYIVTQPS